VVGIADQHVSLKGSIQNPDDVTLGFLEILIVSLGDGDGDEAIPAKTVLFLHRLSKYLQMVDPSLVIQDDHRDVWSLVLQYASGMAGFHDTEGYHPYDGHGVWNWIAELYARVTDVHPEEFRQSGDVIVARQLVQRGLTRLSAEVRNPFRKWMYDECVKAYQFGPLQQRLDQLQRTLPAVAAPLPADDDAYDDIFLAAIARGL
jgi:hypothetical protein